MTRTHGYLTEEERSALAAIAVRTGRTESELIREAVHEFIVRYGERNQLELLRAAWGMWKDREDPPDFAAMRREFDERKEAAVQR